MRQISRGMWTKIVLGASVLFLIMVLALGALNSSVIPERVARSAVDAFHLATGWDMEIDRVEFVGPTRVVLHHVDVTIPSDDAATPWMNSLEAPRVIVSLNPLNFLFGSGSASVGSMTWVSPEVHLNGALTEVLSLVRSEPQVSRRDSSVDGEFGASPRPSKARSADISVVDGRLIAPDGVWHVHADAALHSGSDQDVALQRVELIHGDSAGKIIISGDHDARTWHWEARVPASLIAPVFTDVGFELTGDVQAFGEHATASSSQGRFDLIVNSGSIRWGDGHEAHSVAFDELVLVGGYDRNLTIDELKLVHSDGTWEGRGSVDLARAPLPFSPIEVYVTTQDFHLHESLALLAPYGLTGEAEFAGVIGGSLAHPELSGRLKISQGTVWHRPVDHAEGDIFLSSDRFSFDRTELVKGASTYQLSGEWRSGDGTPHLHITLDSDKGRAEEVLAALGQIGMDVHGEFDGRLTLSGPTGDLHVAGSIQGRDFHLYGQPLDRLDGDFNWNEQTLRLRDVSARWDDGRIKLDGSNFNETLAFQIAMENWPLDLPMLPEDALPREHIAGRLSYTGEIMGTLDAPQIQGNVLGGEIRIGSWTLLHPAGGLAVNQDSVSFDQLSVHAFGHGEYVLTGSLDGWQEDDPIFNVQTEVRDASLSALLDEFGLALPALLVDGVVDGTIAVKGSATNPDARFDLALKDELNVGEPLRLRFQLADGRVRFDGLSALLGVMNGLSSSTNTAL